MMSDWKSRALPVGKDGSTNSWKSRASAIKPEVEVKNEDDPTQSKITAVAAGIANPVGLADEMSAAGSTALNAITGFSGPLAGGTVQDLADEYRQKRDANRAEFAKIQAANPKTYATGRIIGGVATGGMVGGVPQSLGGAALQGAGLGAVGGLGESNADLTRGEYGQAALDTAKGAATGSLGGMAGYGVGKLASSALNGDLSSGLKKFAEKNAVKATGATGKQISNFDENAGRELLDRGVVKFGDTPGKISDRAQAALDEAHGQMDSVLKNLDDKGVTVSSENVINELNKKISTLRKDPSQADVVRKLGGIVEDIQATGESNPLISAAENTKRGYNRIARNWQDPEKGQAGKSAYLAYRDEVEKAATAADPSLADTFIEAKKTHGLLTPIQEAAERRAATLQQSPLGGLKDTSAGLLGFIKGGPVGAVAAAVGNRIVSPRAASMIAVSSDKLANALSKTPEAFGKYAPILQDAAQRGGRALAETNLMLQKDPQYFQVLNAVASNGDAPSTPPVEEIAGMNKGPEQGRSPSASPLKGEDLWAQKGLGNLGIQDQGIADQILNSKQGKQLLIEASDLPAGSKRLQVIKTKLSQGWGK